VTVTILETKIGTVQIIFDLYATKRLSLYTVRDYLAAHKIAPPHKGANHKKTSKGRMQWSTSALSTVIGNECYVGRWHYGKTRIVKDTKTGKRRRVAQPREQWLEVEVPAIISEELFAVAQQRRTVNKVQLGRQRCYEYALGGMLRCGHNMVDFTRVRNGKEYAYYNCDVSHQPKRYAARCSNTTQFRVGDVDRAVWEWIKYLSEKSHVEKDMSGSKEKQS
jgi:site-specific DNA recombinase